MLLRHRTACLIVLSCLPASCLAADAAVAPDCPFFAYLTGTPTARMIAYTPSQLDPRNPANHDRLATSSIRADLEALRPAFDGLVLYAYHEASTPRIVAVAKELEFRAVLLGVWQPKSTAELDGAAALVEQFHGDLAVGVLVGNEGVTFKAYEAEDLAIAAARLRTKLPADVPLSTSEPLVGYKSEAVRSFGDFLAPNIHPVFDRPLLSAAEAAAWARKEAATLAAESGKPVLLKETGFPHGGKAGYSDETQRQFWASYVEAGIVTKPPAGAGAWQFYGVAFEAFDLPWKAEASQLPIEKSWGLLSAERKPYPAFDVWKQAASGGGSK